MFYKSLRDIESSDIGSLVTNRVREGLRIDFKSTLPGKNDEGKKEFLKDISAFANSSGGYLVYGIREEKIDGKSTGIADEVSGIDDFNANDIQLWMESLIRTSIEPRLVGVEFRDLEIERNKSVLVLRVPRSWNAPHVVSFGKHWRFYARNSAGNYQMDVTQLRDAFSLTQDIFGKLTTKRNDLLSNIRFKYQQGKQTPIPALALHIQPFDAIRPDYRIEIPAVKELGHLLKLGGTRNGDFKFNFDGVLIRKEQEYLQIFHSGVTEEVLTAMFGCGEKGPYVKSRSLGWTAAMAIGTRLNLLKILGIDGPVVIGLALLGVKDRILISLREFQRQLLEFPLPNLPDRTDLVAEPIFVESLSTLALEGSRREGNEEIPNSWDVAASLVRPALDSFWNGYGVERCYEYDANEKLVGFISSQEAHYVNPSVW